MIEIEKIVDILPYIVDIYDKLEFSTFSKSLHKGISQKEAGIKVTLHVMKNAPRIKEEIFKIIAILEDMTLEEARKRGLSSSIKSLKALFENDQELMYFFKSAMK